MEGNHHICMLSGSKEWRMLKVDNFHWDFIEKAKFEMIKVYEWTLSSWKMKNEFFPLQNLPHFLHQTWKIQRAIQFGHSTSLTISLLWIGEHSVMKSISFPNISTHAFLWMRKKLASTLNIKHNIYTNKRKKWCKKHKCAI